MRTLRRLLALAVLLVAVVFVLGVFVVIYNTLSPKDEGNRLLSSGAPFPTPVSVADVPLGLYLQQHLAELTTPAGSDRTPVNFGVESGELPTDVATHLKSQGLIVDSDLFVNLVKYLHVGEKIQAGEYILNRTMTMNEIAEALQHGRAKTVAVTIRPGWRAEEIAGYLSTLGLSKFDKDQFLKAVTAGSYDYAFLRDRPAGAPSSIEGFLLPETYDVPLDASTDSLITIMLDTFNQRVTAAMRQQAAASKLTLYEVVTLASIVEREAAVADERPIIASVYLNRLNKKMYLQADPTVQYAMGYQASSKQWWKTPVTLEEYQKVDSPYNTYLHPGLPPGPICNPSLATLSTVLQPAQTDYLFFLAKGDGAHVFSKTLEEQQQNLEKYGYGK